MRRFLKLLVSRIFWTFLFIFLQLGVVYLILRYVESRFELALFSSMLHLLL